MSPPGAWDDYRRRRNLAWFAFLGYVPVVFVIALLSMRIFGTFIPAFVVAIARMVFFVIAGNLALRFPCPELREAVFREVVVLQQCCAAVCPLWTAEVRGAHCEKSSMSEIDWFRKPSDKPTSGRGFERNRLGFGSATIALGTTPEDRGCQNPESQLRSAGKATGPPRLVRVF